jgi:hypothetical protein
MTHRRASFLLRNFRAMKIREPRPEVRSTEAPAIGRTKKGQLIRPAPATGYRNTALIDMP